PQILLIELRAKARLVVVDEHPLAVNFEDAARREAAEQRLAHPRGVDTGFLRERERLADAGQRAADRDLFADLADLPGAGTADVDDALLVAHHVEDRFHAMKHSLLAAHHD